MSDTSILRSSLAMAGGTLLSRITGLLRVAALAYALGQSALSDAYNIANTTPNVVYELLLGGILSATLVPTLVAARDAAPPTRRKRLAGRDDGSVSAVLSVGVVALAVITVAGVIAAPWINNLLSRNLIAEETAQRYLQLQLLYLFLPQIFFYGLTSLLTAIANSRGRFAAAAYAPVLNNLITSAMFLAYGRWFGSGDLSEVALSRQMVLLLGAGTTAGVVAMTAVLIGPVFRAVPGIRWNFQPRHPAVTQMARLSGWTLGYVVANQIALIVIATLALGLEKGAYSAYTIGFIFFQLPHGLFAVSIMTTTLPTLSSAFARGDLDAFRTRFRQGFNLVNFLMLPASSVLALGGAAIVPMLLERGQFDRLASERTFSVLIAFSIGLPAFSAYLFTIRAFYARKDTRTPFVINVIENALNIVFVWSLMSEFGPDLIVLPLGFSLAYICAAVLAVVVLHVQTRRIITASLLWASARMVIATLAIVVVAGGVVAGGRDQPVQNLVVVIVVGGPLYLGLSWLLRVPVMADLSALLRQRLPKRRA